MAPGTKARRAAVAVQAADRPCIGAGPISLTGVPLPAAQAGVAPGFPGAGPRIGVPRRAKPAGRTVRQPDVELLGASHALKAAPPAKTPTEAIPTGVGRLGSLGRRRSVLGLAALPRAAGVDPLVPPAPLVVPRPVAAVTAEAVVVQRNSVLARLPATTAAAERVSAQRRLGRQGEARGRLAATGAEEPSRRRQVRRDLLAGRARPDVATPRAAGRAPAGPASVRRRVVVGLGRYVSGPALPTASRHPLVLLGPLRVRRRPLRASAESAAVLQELELPTPAACRVRQVSRVTISASEGPINSPKSTCC